MITKFKIFESVDEMQIGDYVVVTSSFHDKELIEYLSNNIGVYFGLEEDYSDLQYKIRFYGAMSTRLSNAKFNGSNYRLVTKEEILYFSPNIEDCKMYLDANKYNL